MRHSLPSGTWWAGLAGLAVVFVIGPAASVRADASGSFSDVQLIFARACLECHGPDRAKGGLRFTGGNEVTRELKSGERAVVPGDPDASELMRRVASDDPDERMPRDGEPLSDEQVETLRRWIAGGAEWENHWSLVKPTRPTPPRVKDAEWVNNPIDRFVLAKLEAEGIAPSPEADRATLLRRLHLDLTGLPPSPEQVDAFVQSDSPNAYEEAVDRLLASPRFGERWAKHWLDVARYADSDGYEQDRPRPHAWRWRDWVIDSINRDQPFDAFTRDQIAGDLLARQPGGTTDQLVATGFHRNSLINREGGVDLEEDRVIYTVDRLNTVGAAWLGLTVGCAECHTHKYDPIEQTEFYEMYAFFNSLDNRLAKAPLPERADEVENAEAKFDEARRKYIRTGEEDDAFRSWVERVAAMEEIWVQPESYDLPTLNATLGSNLFLQEDGSFIVTGWLRDGDTVDNYTASINTPMEKITAFRIEVLTDAMLPKRGPGWGPEGNFNLAEIRVHASPLSDVTALEPFEVTEVVADYSQPGHGIEKTLDEDEETSWAVTMPDLPYSGVDRAAVFVLDEDAGHEGGTRLKVLMRQFGGEGLSKIGRFRVMMTSADPEVAAEQTVPGPIMEIARIPADERTIEQRAELLRYFHATFERERPAFVEYTRALAAVDEARGDVWAMTVRERDEPRVTRVHHRGDFLSPTGPPLQPGVPDSLHPFEPRHDPPNRIDLADWLIDPDNPLTARVTVNRFWMRLFGEGLVRTVADFGTQGERPTHPALLDWLATEFIQQGWSRKAMLKTIVMSATYRQSSHTRPDLADRDALNRLLARQNRFRLNGEAVRDQFLAAAGLLDKSIGGPSVGADSHRRGMYLTLKRTSMNPMLGTFDCPDTMNPALKRERSNTPLQALTLLNNPLFVEAAQGLARRGVAPHSADADADDGRKSTVRRVYRLALGHEPSDADLTDLLALYEDLRGLYEADPEAAAGIVGEYKMEEIPAPDLAALTLVARTILNLDRVIMRE